MMHSGGAARVLGYSESDFESHLRRPPFACRIYLFSATVICGELPVLLTYFVSEVCPIVS